MSHLRSSAPSAPVGYITPTTMSSHHKAVSARYREDVTIAPHTSAQRLADEGVTYTEQRVVQAEKVLTSAGLAGIDRSTSS